MREHSRGVRVQVYCGETEQVDHRPRYEAIVEYLRREGAAGATVTRGIAGFGANSREVHTASALRLSLDLPVVVTWIDAPERVERLLPGLRELAGSGVVTVDEVEIASYGGRRFEHLRFDLPVREVMTRPPEAIASHASARAAAEQLIGSDFRALPVVDDDGRLVGIVSSGDLVSRAGLGARVDLLAAMSEAVRDELLDQLPEKSVGSVMTPDPARVSDGASLAEATHTMAERRIKRLPVVDDAGRLVGILSRSDVLRAVGETFPRELPAGAQTGARVVGDIMRTDEPVVGGSADAEAVLDAILSTRLNRAVVVDRERRVLGVVSDADLIRAVDPASRPTVVGALMGAGRQVESKRVAHEFLSGPVVAVSPQTTIAEAARIMIESRHKVLCVVDEERRLMGIVDRADLLHAAGDALRSQPPETAGR
jgi:CBS domain-containing protein